MAAGINAFGASETEEMALAESKASVRLRSRSSSSWPITFGISRFTDEDSFLELSLADPADPEDSEWFVDSIVIPVTGSRERYVVKRVYPSVRPSFFRVQKFNFF